MTSPSNQTRVPPRAGRMHWRTLKTIIPYVWPEDDWGIRFRVLLALSALIGAKIANVYIPIIYKDVVDDLGGTFSEIIALPLGLMLGYGIVRIFGVAFEQLREALFARVTYRTMRRAALRVFHHLHALSLRFHLERRTGGLSRVSPTFFLYEIPRHKTFDWLNDKFFELSESMTLPKIKSGIDLFTSPASSINFVSILNSLAL